MKCVQLSGLVSAVDTWNPNNCDPDDCFQYIDLSAIDQETKSIVGARKIECGDAPSRARQLVRAGDILVSTVRPNLNGVAKVPDELDGATASTGFCVLRPSPELLDGNFLFQWVKGTTFVGEMVRRATGASYPAVSDRIVLASSIPLPSVPEQRRIAAILDQADALRAKRWEALTQLDDFQKAIFIEMFGEPVTNPKGWPSANLGALIHSVSDGPHVSPAYADKGVPFLSARHVRPGEISWNDLKFLSQEDAEIQWKKCKPTRGDILYTKGGTTGFAAVVKTDEQFAVWVHVALLKPNEAVVDSTWLEAMLNSQYCYRQSQDLTHGIANRDLGLKRMVRIQMYHPPLDLQREFSRRMTQVADQKSLQQSALAQHDSLFASLQHRAFQGAL